MAADEGQIGGSQIMEGESLKKLEELRKSSNLIEDQQNRDSLPDLYQLLQGTVGSLLDGFHALMLSCFHILFIFQTSFLGCVLME